MRIAVEPDSVYPGKVLLTFRMPNRNPYDSISSDFSFSAESAAQLSDLIATVVKQVTVNYDGTEVTGQPQRTMPGTPGVMEYREPPDMLHEQCQPLTDLERQVAELQEQVRLLREQVLCLQAEPRLEENVQQTDSEAAQEAKEVGPCPLSPLAKLPTSCA